MKFYNENQMQWIREAAFKAGYKSALVENLSINDAHYIFDHRDNFKNWVPDMDKKSVIGKIIRKVFSYFVVLTDQTTAYDVIEKETLKALEGIKPIETT